jgi:hypothetical protein
MSDNKHLRGQPDRSKISGTERYEVDYAARVLVPEFPNKTHQLIAKAIVASTKVPQFHNNREMVMNSARLKLRNS